ncbi:hypothetical protein ABT297_18830 [Dactylosporangium sp. NPDC000555]|uniref:hypothetical protein n=1 Tax=Dactylosporangium sp. NPDC000555 TaxID=3154260 RepID=UPI003321FD73
MTQTYDGYTLPKLWEMVKDEDPETGFTHVNALNRMRAALEQQRDNLRAQRDRLTEGWPPDRSEAAMAFVGRINDMIDVMTYTAAAAGRICTGVDEVFAAIREARRQLEPLMDEYAGRSPGQGLSVANADHAALNQHGRNVLIAADTKVAKASGLINSSPPPYRRIDNPGESITPITAGSGGGPGSSASGRAPGGGQSVLPAPVFHPPPPMSVGGALPDSGSGAGSFGADGTPALAGDVSGQSSTAGGGGAGYSVPGQVGVIGGVDPGHPTPGTTSAVAFRPGGIGPGGVIGALRQSDPAGGQFTTTPMAGAGPRAGSTQSARRQMTGRPAVSREPKSRGTGGTMGGYSDHSFERYAERRRSKRTDSDELWSVDEGVSPVLDATSPQSHDPGPGVLGIDR